MCSERSNKFNPGIEVFIECNPLRITYGKGVFGPLPEVRRLEDIRSSLMDPEAQGPEELYCISMDVGNEDDREEIVKRDLLFGVCNYSEGVIGLEPVRSQGHIHSISASCNSSTCEVYEIWQGEAIIYMQEYGGDDPGRCYAVKGKPGDIIIVPPGWVHATINAGITSNMAFGAWCIRDYGFDYKEVRDHKGIAFYPVVENNEISWLHNGFYSAGELILKEARDYSDFGLKKGLPLYKQFKENHDAFEFVYKPQKYKNLWEAYTP